MRSPKRSDIILMLQRAWTELATVMGSLDVPLRVRVQCHRAVNRIADMLFGNSERIG